jgi:hypothetical protein
MLQRSWADRCIAAHHGCQALLSHYWIARIAEFAFLGEVRSLPLQDDEFLLRERSGVRKMVWED